jgi:hypothetical protein
MAHLQYHDGDWYLHASMRMVEADDGRAPGDVRLNRGTLNASGEYNLSASSEV